VRGGVARNAAMTFSISMSRSNWNSVIDAAPMISRLIAMPILFQATLRNTDRAVALVTSGTSSCRWAFDMAETIRARNFSSQGDTIVTATKGEGACRSIRLTALAETVATTRDQLVTILRLSHH